MKLYLKKNEEQRIKSGHLWIFSNEIQKIDEPAESGDIVEVYSSRGDKLGYGFYNKSSLIALRMLTALFTGDFSAYAKLMLNKAGSLRKSLYSNRNSYRLCFSESDFMPGLIIDKYNSTFVLQVYCYGMNKNISVIADILKNDFDAKNIFTIHDSFFRKIEGLPDEDEVYFGSKDDEIIDDSKIKYKIDFTNSQKTGFYFDQCDNREYSEKFVQRKSVLDAFCNSGGFGMHAAIAGASSVDFVDSSENAIANAEYNYKQNELKADNNFIRSDVFDYLEKCKSSGKKYDVIMLDPPAFAKNKKSIPTALKGYEKLNAHAIEIINEGGYLITSSCSHHITETDFLDSIRRGARKSGRNIQLLYMNGASLDHPRLPAMPETGYLKFAVFKI